MSEISLSTDHVQALTHTYLGVPMPEININVPVDALSAAKDRVVAAAVAWSITDDSTTRAVLAGSVGMLAIAEEMTRAADPSAFDSHVNDALAITKAGA